MLEEKRKDEGKGKVKILTPKKETGAAGKNREKGSALVGKTGGKKEALLFATGKAGKNGVERIMTDAEQAFEEKLLAALCLFSQFN